MYLCQPCSNVQLIGEPNSPEKFNTGFFFTVLKRRNQELLAVTQKRKIAIFIVIVVSDSGQSHLGRSDSRSLAPRHE